MATIAQLIVDVSANTAQLKTAVAEIDGHFSTLSSAATQMAGAFGIAFSAQAVIAFGKDLLATAGHISDLSDATGVSTTALQEFAYVGVAVGVGMDEIGRAVGTLSQRLAGGDASAAKAVQILGLNVDALIRSGPRDAFIAIGDAVGKLEDPMERNAIAADLFGGKLSKQLIPMLSDLKGQIEAVPKDAIIPPEAIQDADKFGDAIDRLIIRLKAYAFQLSGMGGKSIGEEIGITHDTLEQEAEAFRKLGVTTGYVFDQIAAAHKREEDLTISGLRAAEEYSGVLSRVRTGTILLSDSTRKYASELGIVQGHTQGSTAVDKIHADMLDHVTAEQKKATDSLDEWDRKLRASVLYGPSTPVLVPQLLREIEAGTGAIYQDLTKISRTTTDILPATQQWGASLLTIVPSTAGIRSNVRELADEIHHLGGVFLDIANSSRGSFETVSDSIRTSVHVAGIGLQTIGQFIAANGNAQRQMAALSAGATALNQYARASGAGPGQLAATGALSGATAGFMASGFNPYAAAAGAVVGGVSGYFEGQQNEQQQHQALDDILKNIGPSGTIASGLNEIAHRAHLAGVSMNDFNVAMFVDNPEAAAHAIQDINNAFTYQQDAMDQLWQTAQKYGFTLEQLGPAMQHQELDKQAAELTKDYRILIAAGVEQGAVVGQMQGKVNDFIHEALTMGESVPEAMRPMLQRMVDMGILTDATGATITDLGASGLTFAQSTGEMFNAMMAGIDRLTQAISNGLLTTTDAARGGIDGLHTAIANLPEKKQILIETNYNSTGNMPSGLGAKGMAAGGIGRTMGPTLFYSAGNEDYAFSGEGQRFGGGGGDMSALQEEIAGLRQDLVGLQKSQAQSIYLAVRDGRAQNRRAA